MKGNRDDGQREEKTRTADKSVALSGSRKSSFLCSLSLLIDRITVESEKREREMERFECEGLYKCVFFRK